MQHPVPEVLGSGSLEEFVGYLIGVRFQPKNCSFFQGGAWCCYICVVIFLGGILWMDECLEDGRNEEVFLRILHRPSGGGRRDTRSGTPPTWIG